MYVVLLGAPGAGKGTQAAKLSGALGLAHVSSGELFRENLSNETALGTLAKSYMDRGELVPDDVTIAMVMERLARPDCVAGAILDGFPRTVRQAEALDRALSEQGHRIAVAPYIEVDESLLLARLGGRWTCKRCGAVYHELYSPPRVAGACDACGGTLYQRDDDTPETHKRRIDVYFAQTKPVIDYYRTSGVLVEVDGEPDVDTVYAALLQVVQEAR
ncbi:MAG: adenylate kinase [Anaerolineae bacterium]|nr:adenylate kinase [Anaerolineae bacterium]